MKTLVYLIGDTIKLLGSRDGVVGTASRLRAGHPKNRFFNSWQGQDLRIFFIVSRLDLGPS